MKLPSASESFQLKREELLHVWGRADRPSGGEQLFDITLS